jgi:hypothetical protein
VRTHMCSEFVLAFACVIGMVQAADGPVSGTLAGNVLTGTGGKVMVLSPEGKVVWEMNKAGLVHDAWMLANGNVLYADGNGVTEVSPEKKVVFQYKPEVPQGGGAYGCQRLENGNTLVAENSTGRLVEVDPAGKVVFSLELPQTKRGEHHNLRMARKLKNGNYLVCHSGAHMVREYTPKGEVVLEIKVANIAFSAIRTPQNTTLVASLDHVAEYDAAGKKVWDFANTDVPGVKITNMCGLHLLPNGNIAVGCYRAYDKGEGSGLFEITREKKIVWRFSDPKGPDTLMPIQVLDKDGKALPGECLR